MWDSVTTEYGKMENRKQSGIRQGAKIRDPQKH